LSAQNLARDRGAVQSGERNHSSGSDSTIASGGRSSSSGNPSADYCSSGSAEAIANPETTEASNSKAKNNG